MKKAIAAVLRGIWGGAILVNCLFAVASADENPLPRNAEQLTRPKLQTHLRPEHFDVLVKRWIAQISPADVEGSIAAIELLNGAPQAFVDVAVSRLRKSGTLEKVFTAASPQQKDELRNSPVINQNGLRDLLWNDYLQSLRSVLVEGSKETNIIAILPAAEFMPALPAPIAEAFLTALENRQLGEQARDEISKLLIKKSSSLTAEVRRLRRWLSEPDIDNSGSATRKQVARSVLVRLGEPLSEADLSTLLSEADPQARMAALDQLKTKTQRWSQLYDDLDQATVLSTWDFTSINHFIEAAGPEQTAALNRWNAAIKNSSSSSNAVECPDLRWRLSLLSRQTTPQTDRFETLWNLLTKRSSCNDDISSEVDRTFVAVGGDDLGHLVQVAIDRDGPGQLANLQLRLPQLSQQVSDLLDARLATSDRPGAERLLDLGALPSAADLETRGYWTNVFGQSTQSVTKIDLRALQVAKGAPSVAFATAERIATDETASVSLRTAALLALASQPQSDLGVFVTALSDANTAVSRPALVLLARAYNARSDIKGVRLPDPQLMGIVRTRPDLASDAPGLLQSLVRYGQSFPEDYVDTIGEDRWRVKPGEPCLALAEAPVVEASVLAFALNALPRAQANQGNAILSCVLILSDPNSATAWLAKAWRHKTKSAGAPELLERIKTLWANEAFRGVTNKEVTAKLAQIVSDAVRELPYTPSSIHTAAFWKDEIATASPNDSKLIASELRNRRIYAAMAAIPIGLFAHLALWSVLLTIYPRSPWVQAVVFWNPLVRKLLGLGYIDFVLLHVGLARRRLFAPFKDALLGDVVAETLTQPDRISYFKNSKVSHRPTVTNRQYQYQDREMLILAALFRHRGRVLLLGKSGLGKSSFLRYSLGERAREGRDIIVYLRADQCRQGIEAEIDQRINGLGKEQDLLKSMIYSGRLLVYIDGYNEVDLTTQDLITGFLSRYPYGNILVASQIPLRGFSTIENFTMLPLDADAIRAFLLSRESVLAENATVRGQLFEKVAISFLQQFDTTSQDSVERRAFDEILSNPMDLTSVAMLLGDGRTPDLFALEAQQFEGISRRLAETGVTFRTAAFSSALLQQRLLDQENLQKLPFEPEVVALIAGKLALVRTYADEAKAVASQEIRFRHDRIRDFFTHFAFLSIDQEMRAKYAEDARFAGVFPYLARALPAREAGELRERLITRAADIEDHRVSDSFVREYSWRQKIYNQDPEWMLIYDLPEACEADRQLFDLVTRRQQLDSEVNAKQDVISKARAMTRILAAADSRAVQDAACSILCAMGATSGTLAVASVLKTPTGDSFHVVGLGQIGPIKSFHVEVLLARPVIPGKVLFVVTNARVALEPKERPPDLAPADLQLLEKAGARVIGARDLYAAFVRARATGQMNSFWRSPIFVGTPGHAEQLNK